jgi:hypothetical protein
MARIKKLYEWVIRELDHDGDCADVHHYNADEDKLKDVRRYAENLEAPYELELCRRFINLDDFDNEEDREYFDLANGLADADVPKRFKAQV